MTRKDFQLIAAVFAAHKTAADAFGDDATHAWRRSANRELAMRMADALAADNLRFDRARFLKACGVQS